MNIKFTKMYYILVVYVLCSQINIYFFSSLNIVYIFIFKKFTIIIIINLYFIKIVLSGI